MSCIHTIDKINLTKGKQLLNNRKRYHSTIGDDRLGLIKKSTTDTLGSYIETMQNMNDTPPEDRLTIKSERLEKLQREYNRLTEDYALAHSDYMKELKQARNIRDLGNVNITGRQMMADGRHPIRYHLNKYGYYRQYDNRRRWVGPRSHQQRRRNTNCPVGFQNRSRSLQLHDKTKEGQPLGRGVPCNLEGTMIRNSRTKQISWVTPDGSRKIVPNMDLFEMLKRNGCPSKIRNLSDAIYNRIPLSGTMETTDTCAIFTNTETKARVDELNKQLIEKGQELQEELQKVERQNNKVQGSVEGFEGLTNNENQQTIQEMREEIARKIQELNNERERLDLDTSRANTYARDYKDIDKMITKKYYEYIFWILVVTGISVFTFRQITKK